MPLENKIKPVEILFFGYKIAIKRSAMSFTTGTDTAFPANWYKWVSEMVAGKR